MVLATPSESFYVFCLKICEIREYVVILHPISEIVRKGPIARLVRAPDS